jgi:hypothetical protein
MIGGTPVRSDNSANFPKEPSPSATASTLDLDILYRHEMIND